MEAVNLMRQRVVDTNGNPVEVGARVLVDWSRSPAVVVGVSDCNVDYDDSIAGPRMFPPIVLLCDADGTLTPAETYNVTPITWADYPDGPDVFVFEADLVRVEL